MLLRYIVAGLLACCTIGTYAEDTKGVQPEASAVLLSEDGGQTQMAVKNNENRPLLLYVSVYDANDEAKSLNVLPLPSVIRVEGGQRQIIRFVLEKPKGVLRTQYLKRVTFEGIAPVAKDGKSRIEMNIRYDLPVIISPKGLEPHEAPWELMKWTAADSKLRVHNPSPYVVRLSKQIDLQPSGKRVDMLKRYFVLPGETVTMDLPPDVQAEQIKAVRLFPATLWGYTAPDYDAPVSR